jgi:hypothetical protein
LHLEELDRLLPPLLDPEVAELLDVSPRAEHLGIIADIGTVNISGVISTLTASVGKGGTICPSDDRGDVPWCRGLRRFEADPRAALRAARTWFGLLEQARWDGLPVSVVQESVAAYAVSFFEHKSGWPARAAMWFDLAGGLTEGDPRIGIGLVAYARARKLLLLAGQV